ncbi:receptor-like protein EIX2 isoform X2 [Solanum stenotomum]|uniref:receptor-like protein EIX2 isoform X2 n=1 Tax=Solanum stenotomum TaxID=172797 RepID=UPI0020D0ED29|nr:receptor-like protein EIX2 isoform X2 [Solanum stenotomum]
MKVLAITLWVLLFFILKNTKFVVCVGICRENEQRALDTLKKEVYDPSEILSSWVVGKDCCEWEGVVCNNLTRHVIELSIYSDQIESRYLRINSLEWLTSLSSLENLEIESVDLSKANEWLQVINMLPSLVDLRLFNCSLHHITPLLDHKKISSLKSLNLSGNYNFNSSVPKWVFNLPNLVSLDLSGCNFTGPFPDGPVNLTSLTTFKASRNSFNCRLPKWLFDLNNLEHLVLYRSGIEGAIQSQSGNITKLKYLDLSFNNINSTIPNWIYGCKDLESLFFGLNRLEGTVSSQISNLSSITIIDLSGNMLSGKLPNVIGKLGKLEQLDLSGNQFEGDISELFNVRSNFLSVGLRNTSLTFLRLDDNKLTGALPESVGQLSMLQHFSIFNNRLEGVVTESHFSKLTHLQSFYASRNNLTLKVSRNWTPPFQVTDIKIGGWNIGPLFPMWLRTQKQIAHVDLSDGGIQGEVPTWFWKLSSQIQFLNLSHNQFVGEVPIISTPSWTDGHGGPWTMCFGSNNFSGPLPLISTIVTELDLSNNSFSKGLSNFLCEAKNGSYKLRILNLGGNDLSEEIPDCWMNWPELTVLILRDNNLIGSLPRSMEVLSNLLSLDLRRNRLNGPFPSSLENCTKLHKIDLAENEFIGKLPSWLGMRFPTLIVLILRSNKFDGELPQELCHLKDLQILDLANNTFVGIIPRCIGNLSAMVKVIKKVEDDLELNYSFYVGVLIESAMVTTKGNMYQYDTILALFTSMDMSSNNLSGDIPISLTRLAGLRSFNLSKNNLTGRIPNDIGDMKVLESVDLSENQLYGQIPQSFSSLTTLGYLNLSDNNLSGMIPLSTQLQSFNSTSFQGNKLCGVPLLVNCSSDDNIPNHEYEVDESDKDEVDWFYISMSIGFALSFWGVCGSLLFKRSWRHVYFLFLDRSWEMLLAKLPVC